jgi:uncharacterized membrane protein YhhN
MGLVTRGANPRDGRERTIVLTSRGRRFLRLSGEAFEQVVARRSLGLDLGRWWQDLYRVAMTSSWPASKSTLVAAATFVAASVVHLVTQLADSSGLVADVSKALLMPSLALTLLSAVPTPRGRLVAGTLVALGLSFLGDVLPGFVTGDLSFLVMVGFFLLAQVTYIATYWPLRRGSVAGRRPLTLLVYAAVFVALVAACRAGAGSLFLPVLVHGAALTTMAVLATSVSRLAGVGGAVFMLSDSLIALGQFTDLDLPLHGFWVMLTYVVGQALIAAGVAARSAGSLRAGATRHTASVG